MIETFISIILIVGLCFVVLSQVEIIEEKKRGRREGRLDYYGNEIEKDGNEG